MKRYENSRVYGLKQTSRSWNLRFDEKIEEFCFLKNEDETRIYKKKVSKNIIVFLILYVDDILITRNDIPILEDVRLS